MPGSDVRSNPHEAVVYGIPNCDSVKKARAWLGEAGVAYRFHDFKTAGLDPERLARWMAEAGWETLLNRKGTTWRRLDDAARAQAVDAESAAALMRAQPSLVKRPVIEWPGGALSVGFDAALFERLARG